MWRFYVCANRRKPELKPDTDYNGDHNGDYEKVKNPCCVRDRVIYHDSQITSFPQNEHQQIHKKRTDKPNQIRKEIVYYWSNNSQITKGKKEQCAIAHRVWKGREKKRKHLTKIATSNIPIDTRWIDTSATRLVFYSELPKHWNCFIFFYSWKVCEAKTKPVDRITPTTEWAQQLKSDNKR